MLDATEVVDAVEKHLLHLFETKKENKIGKVAMDHTPNIRSAGNRKIEQMREKSPPSSFSNCCTDAVVRFPQ